MANFDASQPGNGSGHGRSVSAARGGYPYRKKSRTCMDWSHTHTESRTCMGLSYTYMEQGPFFLVQRSIQSRANLEYIEKMSLLSHSGQKFVWSLEKKTDMYERTCVV